MNMKPQFGTLKDAYDQARLGYPEEVYNALLDFLPSGSSILDLGCGTGISTRELADHFSHVVGSDNDEKMIEVARQYQNPNIEYVVAPADGLPFENESFVGITAFGAFHWFCDEKSVQEIQRVLQPEGVFC